MEHGENLGVRIDRQPQKDAPAENFAASRAVHPTVSADAGGRRKSACATSERA